MSALTDRARALLICLLLAGATFWVFWPVSQCGFVFDDSYFITDNRLVQGGLTADGVRQVLTTPLVYASVTWLSHMLNCGLFGLNPGMHHLVNVFFHVGNVWLLFFLLRATTGNLWPAAFAAAFFALHPLRIESVAWIAELRDVLSTFFMLLTLIAYVWYARHGSFRAYILALAFYLLGLMSKNMIVTVPFALWLLDYWPLGRMRGLASVKSEQETGQRNGRNRAHSGPSKQVRALYSPTLSPATSCRLMMEKLPFFALTILFIIATLVHPTTVQEIGAMSGIPLAMRLQNALISYVRYIGKLCWPVDLAVLYPYPKSWPLWMVIGAVIFLLAVTCWVVRALKRHPFLAVGWFWYLGTLVPVIGLIQLGRQSIADRYTYIPLIGVFVMIAWGWPVLAGRWCHRSVTAILAAGILAACGLLTRWQLQFWQNSETLFSRAIAVTKDNDIAHNNLGIEFFKQGKREKAREHYHMALKANPINYNAHNNLAIDFAEREMFAEAISEYRETIRISPNNPEAHNNLGNVLRKVGKLEESLAHLNKALSVKPDYPEARLNLGNSLDSLGKLEEAVREYFRSIQLDPNNPKAYNNLGNTLSKLGRLEESVDYYEKSIRLDPKNQFAHNNFGHVLERLGRLAEAHAHYSEALRINPNYAEALNNLGNILQKQGKLDEAMARYSQAIGLRPDYVDAHFNLGSLFYRQNKFDEAEREYRLALQGNPGYVDARINLGNIFYLRGKYEEAQAHFQEVLKSAPDNLMALNNLGNVFEKSGRLDEAKAQYESVLKRNDKAPEAHNNLGFVLARQGKLKDAVILYRRALELNPAYSDAQKNLSVAIELLRQREEALPDAGLESVPRQGEGQNRK